MLDRSPDELGSHENDMDELCGSDSELDDDENEITMDGERVIYPWMKKIHVAGVSKYTSHTIFTNHWIFFSTWVRVYPLYGPIFLKIYEKPQSWSEKPLFAREYMKNPKVGVKNNYSLENIWNRDPCTLWGSNSNTPRKWHPEWQNLEFTCHVTSIFTGYSLIFNWLLARNYQSYTFSKQMSTISC